MAIAAVVLIAGSALASVPVPVTFEGTVTRDGRLEVRVTAHSEVANRGELVVRQRNDEERFPTGLPLGVPVSITVDLEPRADEVRVGFYYADGELARADTIYIGSAKGGGRRVVTGAERAKEHAATARAAAFAQEETRARRHVASILARGKRPALIAEDPDSPYVQAWNKVVTEMAPRRDQSSDTPVTTALVEDCPPYTLTEWNYSYPLRGYLGYIDQLYTYNRYFRVYEPGYSVSVVVPQEVQDQCGNYRTRFRYYNATTGYNGHFYLPTITSWEPPNGYNPVSEFRATTSFVGLRSGNTMSAYTHVMPGSYAGYYWGNNEAVIEPYFTSPQTPYPFFFRWEEEIRYEKRMWNSYGFESYFTPFRAGYEGWGTSGARFWPVSPGMTVFDSIAAWSKGFVMAHENGHHFQFRLQGDIMQGTGPVHDVCTVLPDKDAFMEGFADWYGVFWDEEGRSDVGITCDGGECFSICNPGYRKEGNVMAYFWDIFDTTNHGVRDQSADNVFYPLSILKNWRATGEYASFPDWYDDFYWRGVWNGNVATTDYLRVVNKVNVAQ
ncbi:MAG TPA: hypothetical protein VF883_23060 [Thermoanaerobaculia bacterium]|jgi:hypothetical protein